MATYTSHYSLKKPASSESMLVLDINNNMDTIDTQIYNRASDIAQRAYTMRLISTDNTWAKIWEILQTMPTTFTFSIYIGQGAISAFTGGAITSGYWYGTGMRLSDTLANFVITNTSPSNRSVEISFSNTTSSSQGTISIVYGRNDYTQKSGRYSDSSNNISAGSYGDISVTFSNAFSVVPNVVVSNGGSSAAQVMDNGKITYVVIGTSTTGFTVRMFNNGSISRVPDFYWIATQN